MFHLFHVLVNLQACIYTGALVSLSACAHMFPFLCRPEDHLKSCFSVTFYLFFEAGSLFGLEFTEWVRMTGPKASRTCLSPPSQCGNYRYSPLARFYFYVDLGAIKQVLLFLGQVLY